VHTDMKNKSKKAVVELPRLAYSINSFCAAVDCSRSTAYDLMKSGRLRYFQVGSKRLITAESAHDCIADLVRETTARLFAGSPNSAADREASPGNAAAS